MTTETVEENDTRKKQKQESVEAAGFDASSNGSRVTVMTKKKRVCSVVYTVASGRHYEKVKQA